MKDESSFSSFRLHPSSLLPFDLVQRMLAQPGAVLLDLDLLHAAGDFDFRAVVEVAGLGALQPDHFASLFCHDLSTSCRMACRGDLYGKAAPTAHTHLRRNLRRGSW